MQRAILKQTLMETRGSQNMIALHEVTADDLIDNNNNGGQISLEILDIKMKEQQRPSEV